MQIEYSKAATKAILAMDSRTKQRIKTGIEGLTVKPPKGDIKQMEGYLDHRYRLRVGKYRIVFRYGTKNTFEVLYIMDIGPRGDIYK